MKTSPLHSLALIPCLLLPALLTSCGTTTDLKSADGAGLATSARKFQKVTINDFTTTVQSTDGQAQTATRTFPEQIAAEIRRGGAFQSVTRNGPVDAQTLVIHGTITRYAEGNATLRFMIGMGAGSAYFDATTRFTDSSGAGLGQIVTDKNSWGLGGALAAAQTPQTFMDAAAKKIAAEARKFAP